MRNLYPVLAGAAIAYTTVLALGVVAIVWLKHKFGWRF